MSDANQNIKAPNIRYELMREEHIDQVEKLLLTSFFVDEPLAMFRGLTTPDYGREFAHAMLPVWAGSNVSYVALDGNRVIGARLASIIRRDDKPATAPFEVSAELKPILGILTDVKVGFDVFKRYGIDQAVKMEMVSVYKEYGGCGIATTLVQKTCERAKELGARAAVAKATSLYTQKLFAKLHFHVLNEILYDDYKDENGELVFDRKGSLHSCVKLVAKPL